MNTEHNQTEQLTSPFKHKEKDISELLEKDSIVWFKDNDRICCGRVIENRPENKDFFIFNFEAWTMWLVDYSRIRRIDVSYYTDEYREWRARI